MAWRRGDRARTGAPQPNEPRHPSAYLVDAAFAAALVGALYGAVIVAREWNAPLDIAPAIDLDPWKLPVYTLLSLSRGLAAYVLSLAFTIACGKLSAGSRAGERVLIPVLDVLQSIPVLSFMPGFVLALVALFPHKNLGVELACVLAIFTGQVWNMTFSFHASLRAIPMDLREVAALHGFGPVRRLFLLELPSAMNGLVWNSMMSMAGGWFFLTIVESFTLDGRTFRLPGLGSYMATAVAAGDGPAMAWAVVAMVVMVVGVDQFVWRPLLCWAERFRNDETVSPVHTRSWVYEMLKRSPVNAWLQRRAERRGSAWSPRAKAMDRVARVGASWSAAVRRAVRWSVAALGIAVTLSGAVALLQVLRHTAAADWAHIAHGLLLTGLRVSGALLVGALWTVPLGIWIGRSPRVASAVQPWIQAAASFPAPMLYPFAVPFLIRAGCPPDVIAALLMAIGSQWYLLFNVAAGAAAMPNELGEAALAFQVPWWRRVLLVDLGAVFPFLITGLVTAAGGAWNASIVSEAVRFPGGTSAVDGVGSFIARAFEEGNVPRLAAATAALAATLVLVNRVLWKPLQALAVRRFAMNR